MDSQQFDNLTKSRAGERTRRNALRTAAVLGAGLVGARALGASAQTVEPMGNKCSGKSCNKNKNCGKGLTCNTKKGKCEYKNGNSGSKGDTCCGNGDCKSGLKCKNNTCKKK